MRRYCLIGMLLLGGATAWAGPTTPAPQAIFLLIGQSNMAGRASVTAADREPFTGVWAFNRAGQWQPAVDPLHWDKPEIAGVGPARTFAAVLRAHEPGMEIGLVPAAVGGSELEAWQPGGKLFKAAVARTRAALAASGGGKLRGILWHQGESDSVNEKLAQTYATRWRTMMVALRKELDATDVPVIVGGVGDFVRQHKNAEGEPDFRFVAEVNAQLAGLAASEPHVAFVSPQGLREKGDLLHFDRDSAQELGRRYAAAWLEFLE